MFLSYSIVDCASSVGETRKSPSSCRSFGDEARSTNHETATHSVDDDDDQSKEEYTSYFLVGVETLVPAMFEKIDD